MHRNRSGLTQVTKQKFMLGEGAIFKNWVQGTDTFESAIAAGKCLGATQGGSTFVAKANVRNIEVDGISGKVTDLDEIDSWDISLQTNFIEVSPDTICAALGAASKTTAGGYTKIQGNTDFQSSDYFTNIAFVGSMSGTNSPIVLIVKNAIGNGELNIAVKNNDESKVPCTFEGRYSVATLGTVPFEIYSPDIIQASNYNVSVAKNSTATVTVTGYQTSISAVSSNTAKATVSVSSSTVTISGVAAGECKVTITDAAGNSTVVDVTVTA
jgi:hypothetical protein